MEDLRARWVLTVGICFSSQSGEGRNGRVRSGWGQIRCSCYLHLDLYNRSRLV